MDPIIISVAPNGARKKKSDHPAIPLTPNELGKTAAECVAAGTSLIHLHIRDASEGHTLDVGIYREATAEIRKQAGKDIIIQATSEAVGIYNPDQQMAAIEELLPEACSLAIREIIPTPDYEEKAARFIRTITENGVSPQYILYSPEEVRHFCSLKKKGVIPAGHSFVLFVLGKKTGNPERASDAWAVPDALDPFLETFENDLKLAETSFGVCAFGGNENAVMKKVVACGGHPRIGFENNHLMADGTVAANNAALISQFVASVNSRPIATPQQARKLLGMR
jgi:3-keto-5-aminohexanoate cleavage enzyme